jgi:hypothetical protein
MEIRERIAEVLHDFYIEASTRKITREEFEAFIDRIIALFDEGDEPATEPK